MKYYLGIDIGASSGRHIVGYYENGKLVTDEVYRFKNSFKEIDNHLVWDIEYLYNEVINGIIASFNKYKEIESLSIDTWGVDYVLLDSNDNVINPVYCYRDTRTDEVINNVHNIISRNQLYEITGTQYQKFNTIYQMYFDKINGRLDKASSYLMIPEYLMFKLTGKKVHEYTNASTTCLMDLNTFSFSKKIINDLGLKESLFTEIYKPGYVIGDFSDEVKNIVKSNTKVVLTCTHDTASAFEAIDFDNDSIFISSGTWSLLGIKSEVGINSNLACKSNFTNEFGPNYIRFLKNIMGLWIIQGLQKELDISFDKMMELSEKSIFNYIYDVNDEMFLSSLNMKKSIYKWFYDRGLKTPNNDNDYIYCTLCSLAHSYRKAINELEKITNKKYNNIYIVGGGAKNNRLNNLISSYCEMKVIPYPIEATAIGNIKWQMEKNSGR